MKLQALVPATQTPLRGAGWTHAANENGRGFRSDEVFFDRRERARRRDDRDVDSGGYGGADTAFAPGQARRTANGESFSGRRASDFRPETGLHLRMGEAPERVRHSTAFLAQIIGQQQEETVIGGASRDQADGTAAYDHAWARRETLFHRIEPVEVFA